MKQALAVTGSFRGLTGHDHHVRSIVRALHNRGIPIQLHDLPGWSPAKLPKPLQDPWFEQLAQPVAAQIHLYFCMPHQVPANDAQRIVNYTMFEADRIPEPWVALSKLCALTLVPVASCRQAWVASGAPPERIKVCPLAVDSSRFMPGLEPIELQTPDGRNASDYKVRFLNVAEVNERKNLIGLLRAWLTTTSKSDDAALLLKPGFYHQAARERLARQIGALEEEARKTMDQAAAIFWITGVLSEAEMPSLYAAATHYVSASFGEGFDLPMLEAAATGLQLVAPKHSAYRDYLNDEIAYLIPARSVPARFPADPNTDKLFAGANWWQPSTQELCATIGAIIAGTATGKSSAREAVTGLSWSSTAALLEQILLR